MGREHKYPRLSLRFSRKGNMDSHLVAVKIRVVGGANQWVDFDGPPLRKYRLECLNAQPVEGWRTV